MGQWSANLCSHRLTKSNIHPNPNPICNDRTFCPHPGCGKGPYNEKRLHRHYQTHIYCADVSSEDAQCACCQGLLRHVSMFNKEHANCVERMVSQLSHDIIGKAIKQKVRLIQASNTRLRIVLQNKEGSPPNSILHTPRVGSENGTNFSTSFVPSNNSTATFVSDLSFSSSEPDLNSNYTGTYSPSIHSEVVVRDFPGFMYHVQPDAYRRGRAMLVNPMDGVI
ncbi:hypothetical protein F4806DRAFT_232329 [Annulohypoxylon nitens]|nr:hypothetical protein F4806DRAFT_232329 [Annulohypoxylon nitens]